MNLAMKKKLDRGEAIDVGHLARDDAGHYVLPPGFFQEGKDYCDFAADRWVWSIGRCLRTGAVLASTSGEFYQNPGFECLWLR